MSWVENQFVRGDSRQSSSFGRKVWAMSSFANSGGQRSADSRRIPRTNVFARSPVFDRCCGPTENTTKTPLTSFNNGLGLSNLAFRLILCRVHHESMDGVLNPTVCSAPFSELLMPTALGHCAAPVGGRALPSTPRSRGGVRRRRRGLPGRVGRCREGE